MQHLQTNIDYLNSFYITFILYILGYIQFSDLNLFSLILVSFIFFIGFCIFFHCMCWSLLLRNHKLFQSEKRTNLKKKLLINIKKDLKLSENFQFLIVSLFFIFKRKETSKISKNFRTMKILKTLWNCLLIYYYTYILLYNKKL